MDVSINRSGTAKNRLLYRDENRCGIGALCLIGFVLGEGLVGNGMNPLGVYVAELIYFVENIIHNG